MLDDGKPENIEGESIDSAHSDSFPLKPAGEVTVTPFDSPPPAGEKTIHPRRIAPIVPTREERKAGPA